MSIRDRGKIKWLPASFMPLQFKMIREMYKEDEMQNKPEIDVYEIGVLENKIHHAMEYAQFVNVKVRRDGFFHDYQGRVCRLDEIRKDIYLKNNEGHAEKIKFIDIKELDII
ncbi:YolD-like family protein [Cytobacillus solani]|uniref:YolD-like family protein n=1 Tax=Cytobacillus solani TaxID=1637975 RepID=UPI00115066D7|nr:YolD-like family protein [Cytobacillus solani]